MNKKKTLINFIELYSANREPSIIDAVARVQLELDAIKKAESNENEFKRLKASQMLDQYVSNPSDRARYDLVTRIVNGMVFWD